jgi:hypothetical protein
VGIPSRDSSQDAERGGDRVTTTLHRKLDNVFRIEVIGVWCERCASGMFNTLIDWQNRDVSSVGQTTGVQYPLQVPNHAGIAVRIEKYAIDKIRPGQMQAILSNGLTSVFQKVVGVRTEVGPNLVKHQAIPQNVSRK